METAAYVFVELKLEWEWQDEINCIPFRIYSTITSYHLYIIAHIQALTYMGEKT